MAITVGTPATNHTASSATATYAFTVAATANPVLFVGFTANKATVPAITSVTYAGVTMTASSFSPQSLPVDTTVKVYLYYLLNPATGSNNVVITFASAPDEINSSAVPYYGVGSVPQDTHTNGTSTSGTLTTTTTIDNSWIVGVFRNNADGNGAAGTGTTRRSNIAGQNAFYDTNGAKTPPGSFSIISTFANAEYGGIGMSIAPPVPTNSGFFMAAAN